MANGVLLSDPNYLPPAFVDNLNTDVTGLTLKDPALVDGQRTAILIIAGQSLMANNASGTYLPGDLVHNFNYVDGKVYSCGNKLLGTTTHATNQSNMATRLGDKLIAGGKYDRVILAPMAVNGTAISAWAGDLADAAHNAAGVDLRPMIHVMARRIFTYWIPTAVLFGQGTTDNAYDGPDEATYEARYAAVIDTFRSAGIDCPFLVGLESWNGSATSPMIRGRQAALVNRWSGIYQGADHDMLDNADRWDTLHPTAIGADKQSTLWYSAIVRALAL